MKEPIKAQHSKFKGGKTMNYQNAKLPDGAEFASLTPLMTDENVLKPILKKHMAPKGKCGYLIVTKGKLKFVWEDTGEELDADPEHPIVIWPERYHHVKITGPVAFKVEFYKVPATLTPDPNAIRPGEQFL